jgi:rhamnulokinase
MPDAIGEFCLKTKQAVPRTVPEISRCILESLTLKYRFTLDELRELGEAPIERIHIIGGGSQNYLLCQWTADATGLPVIAGPAEATAIGNIMVQALALGYVRSLDEIRNIVGHSVVLKNYEPRGAKEWDLAYERFRNIL